MLVTLIAEYYFVAAFFMKLSTPAVIIPDALKTVSVKVDILDFNHKYLTLGSGK